MAETRLDPTIRGRTLPIDREVQRIIKHGRLRKDAPKNPFETARTYVALAFAGALMAEGQEERIRRRNGALQREGKAAAQLAAELRNFIARGWFDALTNQAVRGSSRPDLQAQNARHERIDKARRALLKAELALGEIAGESETLLKELPSLLPTEDAFSASFVEWMAYGWQDLSNRKAKSASREFGAWVKAGHDTLREDFDFPLSLTAHTPPWDRKRERERRVSWSPQVLKAIKRMDQRPAWDRADRYAKGSHPPGTTFVDPAQARRDRARREESCRKEIQAAVEATKSGRPDSEAAKLLLAYRYARASQPERDWLLSLGYAPDGALIANPAESLRGGLEIIFKPRSEAAALAVESPRKRRPRANVKGKQKL